MFAFWVDLRKTLPESLAQVRSRVKPRLNPLQAGMALVLLAGVYSFGIGRARFQARSDFLVRQPMPPGIAAPAGVGPMIGSPTTLGSLEDGRYLAIYLHSPEVMGRVFRGLLEQGRYAKRRRDPLTGLQADANRDQQLAFFRRQVQVWPQELSGVIQLTSTALDAQTALRLNQLILLEARAFVNEMNQNISREQLSFAQQEVQLARQRLDQSTDRLNAFKTKFGQLDPIQESAASSSFITALEAKLVELRVEESSLRRQFRDPQAPEVQFVADQVQELQQQIREERAALVNPQGRDLSGRAAEAMKLQNEVTFATESLRAAMLAVENSRMESQRQLKFLVMLSAPEEPALQDWNWRWQVFLGSIGLLVVVWGVSSFVFGIRNRV